MLTLRREIRAVTGKILNDQTVQVTVRVGSRSTSFVISGINADSFQVVAGNPPQVGFDTKESTLPVVLDVFAPVAFVSGVGIKAS